MNRDKKPKLRAIREEFRLEGLPRLVDLKVLALRWGVNSIEERDIGSEAMLLQAKDGYTIVLKKASHVGQLARQRFSMAHELGHLILLKSQQARLKGDADMMMKQRAHGRNNEEELLCDQIAAEILMPRLAFQEDGWMEGWSLRSLRTLSRLYRTSVPATAMRMVELMPEESLMGVWKPADKPRNSPALKWTDTRRSHFRVPSGSVVPLRSLEMVSRALTSESVQAGFAPVIDARYESPRPTNVPAEALAWGRGEFRQAIVFYYPERGTVGKG